MTLHKVRHWYWVVIEQLDDWGHGAPFINKSKPFKRFCDYLDDSYTRDPK